MKWLITLILILVLITLLMIYNNEVKEGFLSGTDVQLLTSKPYYTWYDYVTNIRRYPYEFYYAYNPSYSYFSRPYPFYQQFYRPYYY